MSFTLVWYSVPVSMQEQLTHGDRPGWFGSVKKRAAEALADMLLRSDRCLYRRIEPSRPSGPTTHQWSIAVETNLAELEARAADMEAARRQGREEAAAIVIDMAQRYAFGVGHCAGVIESALHDAAEAVRK